MWWVGDWLLHGRTKHAAVSELEDDGAETEPVVASLEEWGTRAGHEQSVGSPPATREPLRFDA